MPLDRKNSLRILLIAFLVVTFYVSLEHFAELRMAFNTVVAILMPFLLGGAIAFVLNIPMRAIENGLRRLFSRKKKPLPDMFFRGVSLFVTFILFCGIVTAVLFLIIPELVRTISVLTESYPDFQVRAQKQIDEWLAEYPVVKDYVDKNPFDWYSAGKNILDYLKNAGGDIFGSAWGFASSVAMSIVNFLIGLVFSVNILLQKEKLAVQARKISYALLPESKADKVVSVARLSDRTFSRFLSGQGLEALIDATLFFTCMTILRLPYAPLVSIVMGLMTFIPFIGPMIGCTLGTFFILIVDPVKAVWFVILFVVIQQVEGNLIYPRVVGKTIGLPAMWVLVALAIGANVMGFSGMLIFIPLSSVLYVLFREYIYKRLIDRGVSPDKLRLHDRTPKKEEDKKQGDPESSQK